MATAEKSFKDYYTEDKTKKVKKITPSDEKLVNEYITKPAQEETTSAEPNITDVEPMTSTVVVTEDKEATAVKKLLEEQIRQNQLLLESYSKTNKKFATTVNKLMEKSNETNNKLLEAITLLSEKVELLENKLDEIKDIEIPTPIVNLQMPSKKIVKKVHRDKKGLITHIEEQEEFEEEAEDKE